MVKFSLLELSLSEKGGAVPRTGQLQENYLVLDDNIRIPSCQDLVWYGLLLPCLQPGRSAVKVTEYGLPNLILDSFFLLDFYNG